MLFPLVMSTNRAEQSIAPVEPALGSEIWTVRAPHYGYDGSPKIYQFWVIRV